MLINPKKKHTITAKEHHTAADYNPYEGKTVDGSIAHVFIRGKHMIDGGKFVGSKTHGQFLRRPPRNFN